MAKKSILKTNAMRYLDRKKLKYHVHQIELPDDFDATTVAEKLGVSPASVYKTLVCKSEDDIAVAIIPAPNHLDLKKLAKIASKKSFAMLRHNELKDIVGYIHGACSPFAMKKDFPCFVDDSILNENMVFVSAGKIGLQLELDAKDLINVRACTVCDLLLTD